MLADERRFRISELLSRQRTVNASELRDLLGSLQPRSGGTLQISNAKACLYVLMEAPSPSLPLRIFSLRTRLSGGQIVRKNRQSRRKPQNCYWTETPSSWKEAPRCLRSLPDCSTAIDSPSSQTLLRSFASFNVIRMSMLCAPEGTCNGISSICQACGQSAHSMKFGLTRPSWE